MFDTTEALVVEEFEVGKAPSDVTVERRGKYLAAYNRLVELSKLDPPRGAIVAFPSKRAGPSAIRTMGNWAAADGFSLTFGKHQNGGRELYLTPITEEESDEETLFNL